ncbi:uncharacterized protein LOC100375434 [Saccoglossus kowalevskii]|uniref:Uncharacterized protein LOC100375434 n=1 Tax=Saccoglossus kowalevskii TaxID=10224 RepID=A0ABM0GU35_SACKO|nr:PREDICTED: uncharacterized protein LOC100375434 [Saccoglossus kowalevskii]
MMLNALPFLAVLLQIFASCQAAPIEAAVDDSQLKHIRTARSLTGNDDMYKWDELGEYDVDYPELQDDVYDEDTTYEIDNTAYGNEIDYENPRTFAENVLLQNLYRYIALNILPKLANPEKRGPNTGMRNSRPSQRNPGRGFRPYNKCKRGRMGGLGKGMYGC